MSDKLHLDIETRSRCNLKTAGLYNYAAHESTQLLCAAYAFDDGPVHLWVPRKDIPLIVRKYVEVRLDLGATLWVCESVPRDLREHVVNSGLVCAHKADFERVVLNGVAGEQVGFPKIEIKQIRCTMIKARAHSLPGALGDVAPLLGAEPKDDTGRFDMLYLCKPRQNGTFAEIEDEPERYAHLYVYNATDVHAERGVDDLLPDLTPAEQRNYELDQVINDRGWAADLKMVADAQDIIGQYKIELAAKCKERTGLSPSQTGKLAEWVRTHGYSQLEDLKADTVLKAVKDPECPEECRDILRLFSTYNMKAVTKYAAIQKAVCSDSRLRGLFNFYGANTGRWSSNTVQLQNLFRPVIDDPNVAIEAFKARDLNWLRALYPSVDPMKVLASCIRGALVPKLGHDLVFPDFAGVEARFNAWVHGEEWKLKAFRDYDAGIGPNLYCVVYGRCFNVDPESKEGKEGKQIGKVLDLSMGYEGGVGAFVKMAANYKIDLKAMADQVWPTLPQDVIAEASEAYEYAVEQGRSYNLDRKVWVVCDSLKRLWRRTHPRIEKGWGYLKETAIYAVENPGRVFAIPNKKVMFKVEDRWLCMRLPSGRKLWYFQPAMKDGVVTYYGINTVTRKWGRTSSYGGKWDENLCQGGCRDLLVPAMHALENRGFPLVGSVHDEPIAEVPEREGAFEEACAIMCEQPEWSKGMPIAVDGHVGKRYRK